VWCTRELYRFQFELRVMDVNYDQSVIRIGFNPIMRDATL
jgi:hypothetical protein